MDAELKEYLVGMEGRIGERFDRVEKRLERVEKRLDAVEKRLDGLEHHFALLEKRFDELERRVGALEENLSTLEARIMGRIDAVEERLKDFVRHAVTDLETKLIAEFWKWGRTSDLRTKQSVMELNLLGERVLAVEDRITALERGRGVPPQ